MIIINKTVRLVAAPEPPFVGTRIAISVHEDLPRFGLAALTLADGADSATVDWGDGTTDVFTESTEHVTHDYAASGPYEVRVSEDVSAIKICETSTGEYHDFYAPMVLRVESNAAKLTTIPANSYRNCLQMTSAAFLSVSIVNGRSGTVPFNECAALAEIHFAAAHEEAIKATAAYKNNPPFGAPNATVYFDL